MATGHVAELAPLPRNELWPLVPKGRHHPLTLSQPFRKSSHLRNAASARAASNEQSRIMARKLNPTQRSAGCSAAPMSRDIAQSESERIAMAGAASDGRTRLKKTNAACSCA